MNQEYIDQEIIQMDEKDADVSKCPACGANTTFDPTTQKLICPYCNTFIEFEKKFNNDKTDIKEFLSESNPWSQETHMFRCDNCGAVEILSNTEISKECSYCRASNVIKINELPGIRPSAIVPFAINKDDAGEIASKWVKKRLYAPRKFKSRFVASNLKGLYNPIFTFDSQTYSQYQGRLGKTHIRTVWSGKNRRTYTEIRYFNVSGNYNDAFIDIIIQASSKIKQKIIDKLMPFGVSQSQKYSANYLFGFSANQYNKDGMHCWEEAKKLIDNMIRKKILGKYHYDVIDYLNVDTHCYNTAYKYMLVPIYVGASEHKRKIYNYYINGTHGKITGNAPISTLKILMTIVLISLGIFGIVLLRLFAWFL